MSAEQADAIDQDEVDPELTDSRDQDDEERGASQETPDSENDSEDAESAGVLRRLPGVDQLIDDRDAADLVNGYGREAVRDALRVALDAARQYVEQYGEHGTAPSVHELLAAATSLLRLHHAPSLKQVINATGIILHAQLGRVPLAESAQQAILAVSAGYSTLDYELSEGTHGSRDSHAEQVITAITGAEAALIVNNAAAAVLLIVSALAQSREVIISRGQVIETGGFRLPDTITQGGARLIEVGTTNRTRLSDFERAVGSQTALLIRVHASNFRIVGSVEEPELSELAQVAQAHSLNLIDDLGTGALLDTSRYGLDQEPMVQDSLKAGADLVVFSGDKLLGGPQAGIIVGRASPIEHLKRHPLARAVQIDKLSLAALLATVEHYRRGDAPEHIPVWQMIAAQPDALRERAEAWADEIGGEVIRSESTLGGGRLSGETLPTYALALSVSHPDGIAARLRRQATPVISRIADDRIILDSRTVLPGQDAALLQCLAAVLAETS